MASDQGHDPLFRLTGLSTADLADTLAKNPRAYMALKGAVAEKHLQLVLQTLQKRGAIETFRCGAGDFEKDFYVKPPRAKKEFIIECKNVQVIKTSTATSRREYLNFLLRNQYLEPKQFQALLPKGQPNFSNASSTELKTAFAALPLELRESGLPRYAFSRKFCGIDSAKLVTSNCKAYLDRFGDIPISVDFQRTRNSRDTEDGDAKANRFYEVGELDVVAACLFSRTLEWQFIYCSAKNLRRHVTYKNRYSNSVEVNSTDWKSDLLQVV